MSAELIAWASLTIYIGGIFVGLYVCGRVQESPAFAIFWPLMMVLAPIVWFAVWVYERGECAADHTEGNDER